MNPKQPGQEILEIINALPENTAKKLKADARNARRRARDQAMRDLGLVKVRGAQGGVYWE